MPRLFVALQLPDPLRQAVHRLQHGLRDARWLDEHALHLTLAFVGDVDGSVQRAIGRAGPTPERRKFMPHVTIARFRRPPPSPELERYLGTHSLFRSASAGVGAFHLFSSMLRSSGARYTIEATFPLADAPPGGHHPASSRRPGTGTGDAADE